MAAIETGCVPFATHDLTPPGARGANAAMAMIVVPLSDGSVYANAGDAHASAEYEALRWLRSRPETRNTKLTWKLSHHGSRTSSDRRFLHLLKPDRVWISAGAGNRYGHPSFETLSRLRTEGIPFQRTDEEGAIKAVTDRHR